MVVDARLNFVDVVQLMIDTQCKKRLADARPHRPLHVRLCLLLAMPFLPGCIANQLDIYDSRCQVHDRRTRVGLVPVFYGLPVKPTEEFLGARDSSFPNANFVSWGGCVVGAPTHALVRYCTECRRKQRSWIKKYGDRHGAPPEAPSQQAKAHSPKDVARPR